MRSAQLAFIFMLGSIITRSQEKVDWDTTYYKSYGSKFIAEIWQSTRAFTNDFTMRQNGSTIIGSANNFETNARVLSGFSLSYDKFNVDVGFRTTPDPTEAGRGQTKTFILIGNFGGNKLFFENSFRRLTGFYNGSTPDFDTSFQHSYKYRIHPNMDNITVGSRIFYLFRHKKFSFRAAYTGNYRQVKTSSSFLAAINPRLFILNNDSSMLAPETRHLYGAYGSLHGLTVYSIGGNIGWSGTLVIMKGFYFNFTLMLGPEWQWREYKLIGRHIFINDVGLSGTIRTSLGFNLHRCYFQIISVTDFTSYNSSSVNVSNFTPGGLVSFGWRFGIRPPRFYSKIQQTRIYNAL